MSEIRKYKMALRHLTNPRYMTKDFVVPLYTGTEPDESDQQQESGKYTPFPNDMPIVNPKDIKNQPYEQLNLAEGGSVERQGFVKGSPPPGYITGKQLEELTGIPNLATQAKELMYAPKLYKRQKNLFGDFYKKQLKAKYFDIGQGGKYGTLHYKTPTAEQIKIMKEYHSRRGSKYGVSKATADRMKLFHNDPKLRNYVRNGKLIPDELLKEYGITRNEAAQSTFRLAQAYNGKKFVNVDVGIPKNKSAGKKLFEEIDRAPFGNPYKMAQYKEALNTITEGLGDKYFETTTFENMKREARRILQKEKIPVFDPTIKGSKGINVNELTGVTASSRNKSFPYSQFINLMEGNLNTKAYASFNKQFEKYEKDLQNEIAKGNKGDPNKIIKEYKNYTKSFLKDLEPADRAQIEKLGLPELSLKEPTELYGKKRTAQLLSQGLDLPASYEELGYSIKVPKGTITLKEFINDPNLRDKTIQMIGDLACGARRQAMNGGRITFSGGSDCFNKGLKILEEGNLTKQQLNLASKTIAEAGEEGSVLKNILSKAGSGIKFTGLGAKEIISLGAGPIGLGVGALLESSEAIPELAKGDWRQAIRTTTLGFLPESIVGSRRTDLLRMAKTDEEKNAANLLFDYQDKVDEANKIKNEIERLKNPEFTSVEGYEPDLGMKFNELQNQLKEVNSFLNKNKKAVDNAQPTMELLGSRLTEYNLENIIDPATKKPTLLGNIFGTTSARNKQGIYENIMKETYQEEGGEENKPVQSFETPVVSPEYKSGGRVGFKDGSDPKFTRRGVLGLLTGAAVLTPEIKKIIKGTGQTAKVIPKLKFEKAEGMYSWFPDLVEKLKVQGKPYKEPNYLMEPSYKHEPKRYSSLPKGEEKLTHHIDGDTEFILREYPDGRVAVDIHSPRNQEGVDFPVTLYYRPKMELTYYNGKKIEPAEFKVLEREPRYFANGPDDVDISMSEIVKTPGKNTIYGDVEAAERFATGDIQNRKVIRTKQSRRDQMTDEPTNFIDETSPYGYDPYASGGRVGFAGGKSLEFLKMLRNISSSMHELKQSTHMLGSTSRRKGIEKATEEALTPYRGGRNDNQQVTILTKIDNAKEYLPREYHATLDEMKKFAENHEYDKVDDMARALDKVIDPNLRFENLPKDMFPMTDPLNDAFIIIDPEKGHMIGRYTLKTRINPETRRGTHETFDIWDDENRRFYKEGEEKLKGVESIEKGKKGLN